MAAAAFAAPLAASAQAVDSEGYEAPPSHDGDAGYGFGEAGEEPADPLRVVGHLTFGTSLRFIQDLDYSQDRFGPAYLDLWAGVVLPGNDFRHGFGLTTSLNMSGDGGADIGVDAGGQLVLGPSYGLYIPFGDWIVFPKFSVPIALTPDPSLGFELSVGGAFRILAGFGIYAELAASMFIGGGGSIHPMASGELGVIIDYEVLP